jgi:toxin ParE1/3/4
MAKLHFSASAVRDMEEIDDYTVDRWGEAQAARYLDQLQSCCDQVARNPLLGRQCGEILPGLRRIEQGKHVIFYSQRNSGVYIWRILHESMIPVNHLRRVLSEG